MTDAAGQQRPSLEELRIVSLSTGMELQYRLMNLRAGGMKDADEFYAIVDAAIDSCVSTMARYPKELQKQSEDQLSIFMIGRLEGIGLNASHDSTVGGHCDIVIKEGVDLLWLGEAKLVTGKQNAHIEDGYLQLFSRYATCLPAQDKGGLLIFCNCERIDQVLESWIGHIAGKRENLEKLKHDLDKIEFLSREPHSNNGRQFFVRHKPISVFWAPEERVKG